MAVLSMPTEAKPKIHDKTLAEAIVKEALARHSTARAAAGSINANKNLSDRFRANDQDNFDMKQERYVNSRDYAAKAPDGRYLVVIDSEERR